MGTVSLNRQIYPSCGLTLSRAPLTYAQNSALYGSFNTMKDLASHSSLSQTSVGSPPPLQHQRVGAASTEHEASIAVLGGWGKNLKVSARWSATPEAVTGFAANLVEVDADLDQLHQTLDHRYLNFDVPYFADRAPTLENIARYAFDYLKQASCGASLVHVCVRDGESWMAQVFNNQVFLSFGRRFSVLHRHHREELSAQENLALYGKCSRFHGHSYDLELIFTGDVDELSGFVIPYDSVWSQAHEVLSPLEGGLLNEKLGNTSGELILLELHRRFSSAFSANKCFFGARLRETRKNLFSLLPDLSVELEPLSGGSL